MTIIGTPIRIENDAHWHALRAQHVGGSEVASLFGLNPFQSKLGLWMVKSGRMEPPAFDENERVMWGQLIEPAIAKGVAKLTGRRVRKIKQYWSARPDIGLGGTPDYESICPVRGRGVLEIKAVDGLEYKRKWEDGEPPIGYSMQTLSYMALLGYSWGCVAALVGGNRLVMQEIEMRPALIESIEEEVCAFWRSIDDEEMPEPEFDRDSAILSRVYGAVTDKKVVEIGGGDRIVELAEIYQTAQIDETAAEKRKVAARAELLTLIGDAQIALTPTHRIVSSAVAGVPARTITSLDIGTTVPGRSGFRQVRVYDRKGN